MELTLLQWTSEYLWHHSTGTWCVVVSQKPKLYPYSRYPFRIHHRFTHTHVQPYPEQQFPQKPHSSHILCLCKRWYHIHLGLFASGMLTIHLGWMTDLEFFEFYLYFLYWSFWLDNVSYGMVSCICEVSLWCKNGQYEGRKVFPRELTPWSWWDSSAPPTRSVTLTIWCMHHC